MKTTEIYNLAYEFTEKQVNNIVVGWERDNEFEKIELFNSLVKLGDSIQLACATTIFQYYNIK
jgi:hypothetical protein